MNILYHEPDGENAPLFQFKLCVTMLFRFVQRRPSDPWRWLSNDLYFFTLEDLRKEEPATEGGGGGGRLGRLHGLLFLV